LTNLPVIPSRKFSSTSIFNKAKYPYYRCHSLKFLSQFYHISTTFWWSAFGVDLMLVLCSIDERMSISIQSSGPFGNFSRSAEEPESELNVERWMLNVDGSRCKSRWLSGVPERKVTDAQPCAQHDVMHDAWSVRQQHMFCVLYRYRGRTWDRMHRLHVSSLYMLMEIELR